MPRRRSPTDTFSGKTVLLTGAGGGIGRAMALMLADERADIDSMLAQVSVDIGLPLVAKMIPAIKLLPVSVQDAILTKTGFTSSMDEFEG